MKPQTAVEWLYETLWKQNDYSLPSNILEQAKAMEKKQMEKALTDRYTMGDLTFEEYYNETYKQTI